MWEKNVAKYPNVLDHKMFEKERKSQPQIIFRSIFPVALKKIKQITQRYLKFAKLWVKYPK